ncbi:MAG: indolepyruvate ferredoxin oxidoreductase subunit alpha [Clostridiales bacterium]|jgi:indolepyruvate ferredoxin oxidoreductase alpha subunit|nr:indolepyruvate ferredoxin oxidoreductase subunit alpha [Clostridiales bacterium]
MDKTTKKLALGDYGVARGAYEAGVKCASAYPGTPSTEITEYIGAYPEIRSEWSCNEKVALEVAAGASVGGARAIAAMKHVGLNVAADPLFTLSYTGVGGGLVVAVADDPGMFSSQNEQDSRFYGRAARLPVLEPADTQECKDFTVLAFELSEKYDTPVLLRLTTRVAHGQTFLTEGPRREIPVKPYAKDIAKYVMMPGFAKARHVAVEKRMGKLAGDADGFGINRAEIRDTALGVVCSGAVYRYVREALPDASVYKLGMVYPLPIGELKAFAGKVKELLVCEELEPFIEDQLKAAGIACRGKELFSRQSELSVNLIKRAVDKRFRNADGASVVTAPAPASVVTPVGVGMSASVAAPASVVTPDLPPRPPVLCAGCPHRGVFHTFKKLKLTVFGDIGCYTLGTLPPLEAMDTALCMGASVGMAAGFEKAQGRDAARRSVAAIGDSTFIHSGITGLINAVYNGLNTTVVIMDNATTGMTGHQNHPATGKRIDGSPAFALKLEDVAAACGARATVVNAYDLPAVENALRAALAGDGVSVVITRAPCVLLGKKEKGAAYRVNGRCVNCRACLKLGCPAIGSGGTSGAAGGQTARIDGGVCTGCGVCAGLCRFGAIESNSQFTMHNAQ